MFCDGGEKMNWKDILKAPPLTPEEEKLIEEEMRFRNVDRKEAERTIRRKANKLGQRKQPSYEDYMSSYKEDIESKILAEIKKEGGALGMKNLKQFGEEAEIKRALDKLEKEGKIFMHKDGDIYTHKPK